MISSASEIGKKRPQGQLKRDMQAVSHHPPRSPAPVHPLSCLDEDLATTHPDGRQGIHRRLAIWCIGETDRRPVSLSRNCCREHPARLGRIRRTLVRSVGVNVGVRFCWRRLSIEIHCLRSEFESLRPASDGLRVPHPVQNLMLPQLPGAGHGRRLLQKLLRSSAVATGCTSSVPATE